MEYSEPGQNYPISPLAMLLSPGMPETEFLAFKEDIKVHGQRKPMAVHKGTIIDGRHRKRVRDELGLQSWYAFLEDDTDPLAYVLSMNILRRHLTPSQLAVAAFRLYELSRTGTLSRHENEEDICSESATLQIPVMTLAEAAARVGVSTRSASDAAKILAEGNLATTALKEAVEQGSITVSDGAKVVAEPDVVQNRAVALVYDGRARTASDAAGRVRRELIKSRSEEVPALDSWRSDKNGAVLHNVSVAGLLNVVDRESVDAIITAVPDDDEANQNLTQLAAFASHALKSDGAMILLCVVRRLPEAIKNLRHPGIRFICEFDYRIDHPPRELGDRHGVAFAGCLCWSTARLTSYLRAATTSFNFRRRGIRRGSNRSEAPVGYGLGGASFFLAWPRDL